MRVAKRMANVAAKPEAPLAKLHKITAEPTMIQRENRSNDHVSDKKRVGKQAGLRHSVYVARCEKTGANIRLERGQDLPVDVIEKVDGQEQKESALRATQRSFPYGFHRNCRLQFAPRRL